jgi:hypothetical protein
VSTPTVTDFVALAPVLLVFDADEPQPAAKTAVLAVSAAIISALCLLIINLLIIAVPFWCGLRISRDGA